MGFRTRYCDYRVDAPSINHRLLGTGTNNLQVEADAEIFWLPRGGDRDGIVRPNQHIAILTSRAGCGFSQLLFTRVGEINAKSGKASELAKAIHEKVLPILKKQAGFVDETVLTSDTEPNRIVGLSFWNAKAGAARYHGEGYPCIS